MVMIKCQKGLLLEAVVLQVLILMTLLSYVAFVAVCSQKYPP